MLAESFAVAARHDLVKGFAVGRTIFGETARAWFKGEIDDDGAVAEMAQRYQELCTSWDKERMKTGAAA
jgi:5-dehydro-2-deoxygluconokinase